MNAMPKCPEHGRDLSYIPMTDKFHCLHRMATGGPCGFTYTAAEVYANGGSELPFFAQRENPTPSRIGNGS